MGVEHIWVFDPITRETYVATPGGYELCLTDELTVPGTPIRIVLSEVFATLDKMLTPADYPRLYFFRPQWMHFRANRQTSQPT